MEEEIYSHVKNKSERKQDIMSRKNTFAVTPPMGWNSWDCYGAAVTEDEVRGNAEYLAKHMKPVSYTHLDVYKRQIKVLQAMPCGGRRIAVLGDMLELGSYSKEAHESVGAMAAEYGVDVVLGFGEESRYLCESAKTHGVNMVYYCEKKPEIVQWLKEHTKRGDTVLLKASRGMKFEEIAEAFYGEE